jgi:protein-S-isoprenylcysteine O-methyltransferase Ste14
LSISLLWKILFYGWLASETILAVVTRTRKNGGKVNDRGSMLLIWGTIFAAILTAGWVQDKVPAPMFPGAHWPVYVALGAMMAGLLIRWTAIISLGKAFSVNVAIRKEQALNQSGLYHLVRHPSYSGMMLCFVAMALAERNWISSAILLVPISAAVLYRIHVEEAALIEAFGAQYIAYSGSTKRLIPGIY